MSEERDQELLGMTTWYGLIDDNLDNLHDLSNDDIGTLTTLAEDINDYRASGLARALLELNNAPVDYTEPVYFPEQVVYKKALEAPERPANLPMQFSLSPNPAGESIRPTWSKEEVYPLQEMSLRVIDLQGRMLLQQELSDITLEIAVLDLNRFINGSYILEVRQGEKVLYNEKFIVKK